MLNRITVTGRLCADPELRQVGSENISVCSLRIACQRDFKKAGEEKPATDFFDVEAWRGTADFVSRNFTKGRLITIDGRMETRDWTDKEGKKRVSYEIKADNAYFADSKPAEEAATPNAATPVQGAVPDNFDPGF